MLYPPIVSVDKYDNAVSPYGVFQMSGNVAEWVADYRFDRQCYATAPDTDPMGPEKERSEGFVESSWIDSTQRASRAANRTDPSTKMNWLGFHSRDVKPTTELQNRIAA
ncbi:MAG: SUMF1/EgtB/PvdO family nonheme iron enzyme [Nitrospira sp.]|nr:SUMF1/EgtB/PvdO family nonheme iron enzyme [Nitrospira sp.]